MTTHPTRRFDGPAGGRALRRVITAVMVVALAAGLVVSIQGASGAAALGFTVDSTSDAKDKNAGDGKCETSSGACSLRAAIQEMDKLGHSVNNITLPSGTYTLTLGGTKEEWAAKGDLDIRVNMKILGTVGSTTIKGGSGFGDRLFDVPEGTKPNVTLNGVTLKAGAASSEGRGGGFRYRGTGSFDAINVTFGGNSAGKSGGGSRIPDRSR
jgi:CSLREA domain-containing protein